MLPLSRGLKYFAGALAVFLGLGSSGVQTRPPQLTSLQAFFEALVQHDDPKTLPSFDEAMKVIHEIATMPPEDIARALPSILTAFQNKEDTVKGDAATAIFSIGERPDGGTLLKPYGNSIGSGLDAPNPHVQGAAVELLAILMLKQGMQSEAVPLVLSFIKRTDRSPIAQAGAISYVLRFAPDDPDLTPALRDFLARPMDEQTTIAVVNSISNSHTKNLVATDMLIRALEDPSEQVRFQAAQGFQSMPKDMVARAKPLLQKTIERPDESQEVKDAAKEALRRVEPLS